jgi:hypothetical protein
MSVLKAETGAYQLILDRPEATAHVEEHFRDIVAVLVEMVDYGTHLIPRCLASSSKRLTDVVLLPVLTKQAVEFLDAAQVLLASGCVNPAALQLRALFEVSVYIAWIVRRDTDRRARAYYVANLRRRLDWAKRVRPGTDEFERLTRDYQSIRIRNPLKDRQSEVVEEIGIVERRLAKPDFRQMNRAFARRRGTRSYDPDWYAVLFPKKKRPSLYTLAKQVDQRAQYRLIYEQGSEAMHSSRLDPHIRVEGNAMRIRSLRELTEFSHIAQLLMGEAMSTFRVILRRYRPSEADSFAKKYVDSWRAAYMERRVVKYEYVDRIIS